MRIFESCLQAKTDLTMKVISNNSEQTHKSIIDRLLDTSDEIIICVAFLKLSGLNKIIDKLRQKKNKSTFHVGTDFYLTEPSAIRKLFNDGHIIYITNKENATYHPKIFYFKNKESVSILIGSANLTSGGLETNIEASLYIDTVTNSDIDNEFKSLLSSFKQYSIHVKNEQIISDYEKRYNSYKQKHTLADNEFEIELQKIIELENERNNAILKVKTSSSNQSQPRSKTIQVRPEDYEDFPIYLPQYIEYKQNVRTSGVVNKETTQRDLLRWYERMKDLIKHQVLPDDLAEQLIDAGFPFGNGWGATIRMMWNKRFLELLDFKEKEQKHLRFTYCPQTKNKKSPYYSIGGWCAQQKLRRKELQTPAWDSDYEEAKMKSINYLWDNPTSGSGPDDEWWYEALLNLEKYYDDKKNYKTVPSQKTDLGRWLNEQMTLKNTGSRQKEKKFLHPIREELLGDLLKKNGVGWKWKEQKERESIMKGLKGWQELNEWTEKLGNRKPSSAEVKYFKPIREWIALTRYRSKKWDKVKEKWKLDMFIKAGFPLP